MSFSVAADLATFFEVDRICSWILSNNFRCVALQLPDELLVHAFLLVEAVERGVAINNEQSTEECGTKLYVLADTSYRSCCLDEIAAEHVACDSIVHFGDACLSACGSRMPSLYIFCRRPFELKTFIEQFKNEISEQKIAEQKWDDALLICEAGYTHIQDSLGCAVASVLPSSIRLYNFKVSLPNSSSSNSNTTGLSVLGRQVPEGFDSESTSEKRKRRFMIIVGSVDSPLLPIAQMTLRHIEKTIVYCPQTRHFHTSYTLSNRMLLRRLYLVERLRDARTVGLVIGAVALRGCREAVARVRKLCEKAGKKLYVMYIGKLNEAKLSNFGIDVDCFVLLSCPFGIILDGTKFCRPILTVFEAEIALNPDQREWLADMQWTPNFEQLAKVDIGCRRQNDIVGAESELMSLTSGNIRHCCDYDDADVATNNENPLTSDTYNGKQLVEYSAGDYFAMRSWRGLEDNNTGKFGTPCTVDACDDGIIKQQCPCELKQGMDGIATQYSNEPCNSEK